MYWISSIIFIIKELGPNLIKSMPRTAHMPDFIYTYHLVNAHLLYAKFGLRDILDYSLKNCINAKIIPLTRFYYKHFVHKKRIIAMCFIEVDDLALIGQVMPVIQTKTMVVIGKSKCMT